MTDVPEPPREAARRIVAAALAGRGAPQPTAPQPTASSGSDASAADDRPDGPQGDVASSPPPEDDVELSEARVRARALVAEVLEARASAGRGPTPAVPGTPATGAPGDAPADEVPVDDAVPAAGGDPPDQDPSDGGAPDQDPSGVDSPDEDPSDGDPPDEDPSRRRARELVAAALADAEARAAEEELARYQRERAAEERVRRERERARRIEAERRAAERRQAASELLFAPGEPDAPPTDAPDRTIPMSVAELAAASDARTPVATPDRHTAPLTVPADEAASGDQDGPVAGVPLDDGHEPSTAALPLEATVEVPHEPRPRRTGRWLLTSILGAIALAVLFPLAVDALRTLVQL